MAKYILGAGASLLIAAAAAASPFGGPAWFDGSGYQSVGQHSVQAHSLDTGELVYGSGGGFTLGPPAEVVSYASGISSGGNGPFIASFSGSAIRDDYAKDPNAGGNNLLTQFQFVGGVATAGEQISVFFLDDDENVVDAFNVTLPQGGNFIWTITLVDADGNPLGFQKADSGYVQIQHAAQGNITWFATDALHVGSNMWDGTNDGTEGGTMYAFTLTNAVPAPGALALLGLAGLVGASRRRRA